jgi:DNA-binding XRE family transcriptional regulator
MYFTENYIICYVFCIFDQILLMKARKNPKQLPGVQEVLKEIGVRIRKHRKSIASNYENFAAEYGFVKMTIYRIENGKNFNMDTLIRVLRVLNITIEEFFRGIL